MMTMLTKSRDGHVNHDDWSRQYYVEEDEGATNISFQTLLKTTDDYSNADDNDMMLMAIIMIMMKPLKIFMIKLVLE